MTCRTLDSIERYLWYATIAGHAILYFRLWRTGLRHTYKFFSCMSCSRLIRSLLLESASLFFPASRAQSNLYAQLWMATEPVLWILYVLVVLELYTLVFQQYKGIASLGRWVVLAGLAVAVVLSSISLSADLSNPAEQFPDPSLLFCDQSRRALQSGGFSALHYGIPGLVSGAPEPQYCPPLRLSTPYISSVPLRRFCCEI